PAEAWPAEPSDKGRPVIKVQLDPSVLLVTNQPLDLPRLLAPIDGMAPWREARAGSAWGTAPVGRKRSRHAAPYQGRRRPDGSEQRRHAARGDRRAHARPARERGPRRRRADRLSGDGAHHVLPQEDPPRLRPVLRDRGAAQ